MSDFEFPADLYYDLLVYDDRDALRILAHQALLHKYEDPPDRISTVDPSTIDVISRDVAFRRKMMGGDAPLLRTLLQMGARVGIYRRNISFEFALTPWATADLEHTRVATGIYEIFRYDLFTEEHHIRFREEEAQRREARNQRSTNSLSNSPDTSAKQ